MRVVLVYPRFEKFAAGPSAGLPAAPGPWSFRMPPSLAIPILAQLLPPGADCRVVDRNLEPGPVPDDADLYAFSFFTPQAADAYAEADRLLALGKTVVMGGLHPSAFPEDALPHCRSLCVGEAEGAWPRMLADLRRGRLRRLYRAAEVSAARILSGGPAARQGRPGYDWAPALISAARGCPCGCSHCAVPIAQGQTLRLRPLRRVLAEAASCPGREFFLIDDLLLLDLPRIRAYMRRLCAGLAPLRPRMFASASPALGPEPEFLDALAAAGTRHLYMVFADDPASVRILSGHRAARERFFLLARGLEARGIILFASFGLGFDFAGEEQFEAVAELCRQARIRVAEFFIATPFPGTPLWRQTASSGRLLQPIDWSLFNGGHAVFRPRRMPPERLEQGFRDLWSSFYKEPARCADAEDVARGAASS